MSQLFTFFVCSRRAIEKWADALASGDEAAQDDLESKMSLVLTLKSVGDGEFNILARSVGDEDFDAVTAVGEVDLVREMSDSGPWVTALRRPAVEAVAGMRPSNRSTLQRWVKHTAAFMGRTEERCAEYLTADAASELKRLSSRAIEENLPLFVYFAG